MNGGKVIYHFEADDSNLKKSAMSVGNIVKGNLISSAVTSGLSKVWGGIKNITSSITNLAVKGGFDRAFNIEQAEFKLKGLGHSAEETQAIMDDALASVKGTAYGMDEAATVAASAVAAGVKPGKDLQRTLKLVGDAAAISGRDMESMGAIFNKVAASGKMTGEELNQLTDSGIPMLQLLSENLGVTTEEVRDMVSAGKIGFAEFQDAIEKGMGGAALTMGQTFNGALENTKAAMSRLGKTFMDPFMKGMTPALNTLIEIIDMVAAGTTEGLEEKTKQMTKQLGDMINNVIKTVVPIIKNVIPIVTQVIKDLVKMIPKILKELLPILIDLVTDIINALVDILPTIIPILMDGLLQLVEAIIPMLPQIIQILIQCMVLIVQALAKELPTIIPLLINAIIDGILTIVDNVDLMIDAGIQLIVGLIEGLTDPDTLVKLLEAIPKIIIKLAEAIVKSLPKIIEAGAKIIVALGKGIASLNNKLGEWGRGILNKIWEGLKGIASFGINMAKGLWEGLSNSLTWIKNKIKSWVGNVLKFIKSLFGIHSPSTEFEFIGKMNMLGLEQGMEGMQKEVQGTIDSMFNLQPNVNGTMSSAYSPQMNINIVNNLETDPLGQLVNSVKTFSGGAKNDYNWGAGI